MNNKSDPLPVIAVPLGDPAGIGSELVAKLLAQPEVTTQATVVVVGDRWLWEQGQAIAKTRHNLREVSALDEVRRLETGGIFLLPLDTANRAEVRPGIAAASGGHSVIKALSVCLGAATRGHIDGICFAPLNKLAIKQAGFGHQDELHFFAEELAVKDFCCELNVLENLWTARVTSHIPLRDVATNLTAERVKDCIRLVNRALLDAGFVAPRIAVAALNPHAGEGGTCGTEEIEIIDPSIAEVAAKDGIAVKGSFPSDTVFRRAKAGDFDAVVTMYHDQGQIALKLLGAEKGVTVHGGLPIVITTPAQGTAYDIVGQNRAHPGAIVQAFRLCAGMAARAVRARSAGQVR